ncbi:hypothetical protein A7K94_0221715, partial [Modestobacter sp. VKM Ac-2676]
LVPGAAAGPAATRWAGSGCRRCTCGGAQDAFLGRAATEATGEFVSGPYALEVLEDADHWLPELAADRVGELVTAHVRTHG